MTPPPLPMTEDDRAALVQQAVFYRDLAAEWQATAEGYRADVTLTKDKCDAQAAAIERVRAVLSEPSRGAGAMALALSRALAAAPEHTAPVSFPGDNDRVATMAHKLLAAEARIAKLRDKLDASCEAWANKHNAANARAEAAEERAFERNAQLMRAESEAAALRAEIASCNENLTIALDTAAALRAEVERLQAQVPHPGDGACERCGTAPSAKLSLCHECREAPANLAAANALLDEAAAWIESPQHQAAPGALMLARRIRERKPMAGDKATAMGFAPKGSYYIEPYRDQETNEPLSSNPAPSERAAAERQVLEACEEISDATLRLVQGRMRGVARAELTRRAAAK